MDRNSSQYRQCVACLEEHLKPAMGCTEPIAVAYAAALCRETLGCVPERAQVLVSGNIIKNAMGVKVPRSGGRRGIDVACAIGLVAGKADRKLEVLAEVTPDQLEQADMYLAGNAVSVDLKENARLFDIEVTGSAGAHTACVRLADHHTNVVSIRLDGRELLQGTDMLGEESLDSDENLSMEAIYDFAVSCDLEDVRDVILRQVRENMAIAREGLHGAWGAEVGRTVLDTYGDGDVRVRARALAAAGSDARMAGCEMPVIINSGSGNQGITVSVPVAVYAEHLGVSQEVMIRALVLSNLIAIHEKSSIGCLSAYCGAISAGCASGAGIAFLYGADLGVIEKTVVNSLAILSGTICDGAKPSCAAKIASAVDAAILSCEMAFRGRGFRGGEGIVKKGVEPTIASIGRLARDGMRSTDEEILRIMISR